MIGSFKSWTTAAVVGLATLAGGSRADAFFFGHSHGSHGSSGGSWGGSHGSWGSGGGSWGSHGGSWGSHGSHGSWGGSSGSYGGYGSHGSSGGYGYSGHGYSGGYGSSGGSSGGYSNYGGGYSAPVYNSAPGTGAPAIEGGMPPAPPAPGGTAPLPNPDGSTRLTRDSVLLTVNVPAEAKVYVNDLPTRSTGSERRYLSRGLSNGRDYTYTVRAEIERDGKLLTETKTVQLQGGQFNNVSFGFENAEESLASKPLRTALIVNVPADAKVFLAGKETTTSGPVREFATTKLAAGDAWKDYTIRVQIERGGRTLTKEETVSISAGESREMNFNFDAPEIARVETAEVGL